MMKITGAMGSSYSITEEEVDRFLESKLNLQLANTDEMGDPNIQPVWFEYDKDKKNLFIMTLNPQRKPRIFTGSRNSTFRLTMRTFRTRVSKVKARQQYWKIKRKLCCS